MIFTHTKRLLFLTTFAVSLLSGCGILQSAADRDYRWPEGANGIQVQWTAESGIDLDKGIAVPVRAYLESYDLVLFTGNIENAYPGFQDAVPPNEPSDRSENNSAWDRRPYEHYRDAGATFAGNLGFHIQAVERTDTGATVTVCEYRYALGARRYDGSYDPVVSDGPSVDRGIAGIRLNLVVPPAGETGVPLPAQRGSALAPGSDVFDGWEIVGRLTTAGAGPSEWPARDQVLSECIANAPDALERRNRLARGPLTAADFASSPADPGWPE